MKERNLSIVTWPEIREEVYQVNAALAQQLDNIDPDKQHKLVRARYRFGDYVLKNGLLCLPWSDASYSWQDNKIPAEYFDLLPPVGMSMGLTLNRSLELLLNVPNGLIPFSIMNPGKVFALWSMLHAAVSAHMGNVWSITAGGRSTFLLPKITETGSFWRLKKEFGLQEETPRNLMDQWNVFKEITQQTKSDWYVDVIFFTNPWLETNNKSLEGFRLFLLETAWYATAFLRNKVIFDSVLSFMQAERKLKTSPYIINTVEHLQAVGSGFYPGFVVANDDMLVPVKLIQKVFVNVYGLKYSPTVMHLNYLTSKTPICYYSLQHPTLISFSPKPRAESTNIKDLEVIDTVMQNLIAYILEDRLDLHNSPIYQWAKKVHHEYLHYNPGIYRHVIKTTEQAPKLNTVLKEDLKKRKNLPFCDSNTFMRGCIQLSLKK